MRDFDATVAPVKDCFVEVIVPFEKMKKIEDFIQELIEYKEQEEQHKIDGNQERTRWISGLVAEAAVEELLGIEFIDWTVGPSHNYNKPDINGRETGVKCSEWGKFPVIYKDDNENDYPQIICLKTGYNIIEICGIADEVCLQTYQDDELIHDPDLKKKGTKTGFYGFRDLEFFHDYKRTKKPGLKNLDNALQEAREMRELENMWRKAMGLSERHPVSRRKQEYLH